jgi:uncharacterized protein YfiM (DUF2279 family)
LTNKFGPLVVNEGETIFVHSIFSFQKHTTMQKISFFSLALLAASLTATAQTTKIDVQKGQKYKVENSTKLTSAAEVMGQTMENNTDSKSTTLFEILATGQDGINLQSTVTKMTVTASAMGQDMSYDSDKTDNSGPLADMLSAILNKPNTLQLNDRGLITKQDQEGNNTQSALTNGAAVTVTTDLFIPALIGKELKTGDSFTDTFSVKKEKYDSRDSGTYTVKAIENGLATISYAGTQVVNAVLEQMGMEMNSYSNNTVKSDLYVDIKTGLVLLRSSVIESSTTVDVAGMSIPATGKTIINVKVSPEK